MSGRRRGTTAGALVGGLLSRRSDQPEEKGWSTHGQTHNKDEGQEHASESDGSCRNTELGAAQSCTGSGRRQSPLRPPLLASNRTGPIVIAGSALLSMS